MSKSITKNYIFSLINTLSSLVFPLVTFPYVTRVFLAEDIGQVNFYTSIIAYVVLLVGIGIPTYATRQIARVRDDRKQLSIQTIEILSLHFLLTLFGYIAVAIMVYEIPEIKENIPLFLLLSVNILFTTLGCEWFFQGIEEFQYIAVRGLIIRTLCVILLFIFVHDRDDLIYYGAYSVFGVVGNNIFNFVKLLKIIELKVLHISDIKPLKHLKPAVAVFGLSLISSLYLNLDTVMLGFLSDNASVGYYSAAIKLVKTLMGVSTSLTLVMLPRLSNLAVNGDIASFNRLVSKSIGFVIFISLPLVVLLICLAPDLVHLFCGQNYEPAIVCMQIISPILLLIGVSYVIAQTFYPLDKVGYMYYSAVCAAVVNLLFNFLLIPHFSANGAAVATVMAELSSLLMYLFLSHKFLGLNLVNKSMWKYLLAVFCMVIILQLAQLLHFPLFLNLVFSSLSGGIVYFGILYMMKDPCVFEVLQKALSVIKK